MQYASQPVQILVNERLVELQLMTQRIDFQLADDDVFIAGNHLTDRISRGQHHETERDEADAQKNDHHLHKAQGQLFRFQSLPPEIIDKHT